MKYFSPKTTSELLELLDSYKADAVVAAGCTDILVKKGFFDNKKVIISTNDIDELKQIEDQGNKLRIGACVTFSDLLKSKLIQQFHKPLYQAAKVCGSVQIRNRATLAGNIINASPAADSIPALMVSNTFLTLASKEGTEIVDIKQFFTGPGKTILQPGQIVTHIETTKDIPGSIGFYRKIGTRKALSIAKASVAFKAIKENGTIKDVEFAYGSVGPVVISSNKAKEFLNNKPLNDETIEATSQMAFNEVTPISDVRSTADYRKLVVKNVIIEELKQLI